MEKIKWRWLVVKSLGADTEGDGYFSIKQTGGFYVC